MSMREAVMGKQTMRQPARLAASQAYATRRREWAQRDRRLEKLAIEVLTALGERDATVAATEQRASAALQAMITDESVRCPRLCSGAPALSVIGKRPGFAIQPQAHNSRGDSS